MSRKKRSALEMSSSLSSSSFTTAAVHPFVASRHALEEKRAKEAPAACPSCGNGKFMYLTSRTHDNNYATLPCGKEIEGYCPNLSGICDSDGAMISVCISCGRLQGFDPVIVRQQLDETLLQYAPLAATDNQEEENEEENNQLVEDEDEDFDPNDDDDDHEDEDDHDEQED